MLTFSFGERNMRISTNSLVISFTCRIVVEDAHLDVCWFHHFHWNNRDHMIRKHTAGRRAVTWRNGYCEQGESRKSGMRRKNAGGWVRGGGENLQC